jgi:hypothetical protein
MCDKKDCGAKKEEKKEVKKGCGGCGCGGTK